MRIRCSFLSLVVTFILSVIIIIDGCKKSEESAQSIVSTDKYVGKWIIEYGYTSSFFASHIQNNESIALTEGYILLDLQSKKYERVFKGHIAVSDGLGLPSSYDTWKEIKQGSFQFSTDKRHIIFDNKDMCSYYQGNEQNSPYSLPTLEVETSFSKGHLYVFGMFIYQKESAGFPH